MPQDNRNYQTKRQLTDSLKKLMESKPLNKISIREICEGCGVNRQTFYYHFEDIYALLKWTFEQEAVEVVRNFDLLVDYEEAITFVMNYVEENNYILNCAYDSIGQEGLKRFFCADFSEVFMSVIEQAEHIAGMELDADYREFLCSFYVEAITGLLIDWIKRREHRDRETVIEYITSTVRCTLMGVLRANEDQQQ